MRVSLAETCGVSISQDPSHNPFVIAGHSSPARFKLGHSSSGGRKLGGTRTSGPQLGPTTLPVLNQIHEEREAEESGGSPCEDRRQHLGAPAGAAVLRRLEQRRRLHKVGISPEFLCSFVGSFISM